MNDLTRHGKANRSRATARLRNLTIGTTLAGLAASAGFGLLAAATYDGSSVNAANAAGSPTTTTDSSVQAPSSTSGTTDSTGGQSLSPSPSPTSPSSGSSTNGVSGSPGRAHVSTGGS